MSQKPTDHIISATISTTGEVIEYHYNNSAELSAAYKDIDARLNAYRQLKRLILDISMQIIMKQEEKKERDNADTKER